MDPPVIWPRLVAELRVSRETEARLARYVDLLVKWRSSMNLIGSQAPSGIWDRHIADSAQLLRHRPDGRRWIDLGSGAGFPGLVIAILLADQPDVSVTLVEANHRKAAFLRLAAAATQAPAVVAARRIEAGAGVEMPGYDVVTARALAPLGRLLDYATPFLQKGATGLFLKGQDVHAELTAIPECWKGKITLLPSVTDTRAHIVVVAE